jgi:hypothetical protein
MAVLFPPTRSLKMSAEMTMDIWKWRIALTFAISTSQSGNHFQPHRGNGGWRDFHMSTISTPYGGTGLRRTSPAGPGRGGTAAVRALHTRSECGGGLTEHRTVT